jgi:hypothetical protein
VQAQWLIKQECPYYENTLGKVIHKMYFNKKALLNFARLSISAVNKLIFNRIFEVIQLIVCVFA